MTRNQNPWLHIVIVAIILGILAWVAIPLLMQKPDVEAAKKYVAERQHVSPAHFASLGLWDSPKSGCHRGFAHIFYIDDTRGGRQRLVVCEHFTSGTFFEGIEPR